MDNDMSPALKKFLYEKRDYSHLLVHLTRSAETLSAKDVLGCILDDCLLKAYHAWCIWYKEINRGDNAFLWEKFKVVCFTETPIEQLHMILKKLPGRLYNPEPYGLVFEKSYIKTNGGNQVFYMTKKIATPLHELYERQKISSTLDTEVCRFLALTTLCEKGNDWHWEREWRVMGDLKFNLEDIYCGLCPEAHIEYFRDKYPPVNFIDPSWENKRMLDELVKQEPLTISPEDIPF